MADVVWASAVSVAGVVRACAGTVADVSLVGAGTDVVGSLVGAGTDVVGSLATGATANVAIVVGVFAGCGVTTMAMLRTWLGPTMVAGARG
ncbi:MAG: hypothetical protein V3R17_03345 [Hyphomicrobium sp.]